jgi:tRNA A-37 threonylcarbamoyl transferase component Bud32
MKSSLTCPPGFICIRDSHKTVAVREDYKTELLLQGIDNPDKLRALCRDSAARYSGRGATPALPIAGRATERMILRPYRRGGLLRLLVRDLYWRDRRPLRELRVGAAALQAGIPTAAVLAAVAFRVAGPLYRGYLITRELTGCSDLPSFLGAAHGEAAEERFRNKRTLLARIARAVRAMHDRGFYHGDLNLKNILINAERPNTVYIIDWDKSHETRNLSLVQRSSNMVRFCRSMEKLREQGLALTERDQLFFLQAYWGKDASIKKRLRKDFMRMRLFLRLRKLSWSVERVLGRRQ